MKKTALITGSAKGLGKAIALEMAKYGYRIVLNTKSSEKEMMETLEEILAFSPDSVAFKADVSIYDEAKKLFDVAGNVDLLVNNAGISYIGLFNTMEQRDWQRLMQCNVDSMFNCTHLALPYMIKNHSGSIVNISSMWGISGASCEVVYSASKGAVNAFTKALGKELAPSGIFVNAIACGAMETTMNNFMSEEEHTAFAEEIPMGRFGKPEEVANLVKFLALENTYITGQVLSLDGGMM